MRREDLALVSSNPRLKHSSELQEQLTLKMRRLPLVPAERIGRDHSEWTEDQSPIGRLTVVHMHRAGFRGFRRPEAQIAQQRHHLLLKPRVRYPRECHRR